VSSDESAARGNYRVPGFAQHLVSVFKDLFPIFVKGSIDAFEGIDIRPVEIIIITNPRHVPRAVSLLEHVNTTTEQLREPVGNL
jgi:hypothetical protein